MGGVYEPPCVNALPDYMAQRVRTQGVSVTDTILATQVAAHAGDIDQTLHTFLNNMSVSIHAALVAGQGG